MAANDTPIITISTKPEIVVVDEGQVSLISHGTLSKVSLETSAGHGRIVYETASGEKTTLAEGGAIPMAEAFSVFAMDISDTDREKNRLLLFRKLGFIGALLLGGLVGYTLAQSPEIPPQKQTAMGSPSAIGATDIPQMSKILQDLQKRREKLEREQVPAPKADLKNPAASDVYMIPSKLPPLTPDQPVGDKVSEVSKEPSKGLLDKLVEMEKTTPVNPAAKSPVEEAAKPGEPASSGMTPNPEDPAASKKTSKSDDATETKKGEQVSDADVKSVADEPLPKVNQEAVNKAIRKMVDRGMTTDEALKLLTNLQDIGAKGEQVTPEMLAGLPHEVAEVLADMGLVEGDKADAPDGTPYRIIRLPENVMDGHRGPDGIPNIPERNSWASTGNFVSLPLPGGGDIKSPETMKEFGLKP